MVCNIIAVIFYDNFNKNIKERRLVDIETEYIKSPMNYVGGKYKLLPQIIPLLPKNLNTVVDLFCGGLDFSINIKANKIICNDIITPMINMYNYFKSTSSNQVVGQIQSNINKYNLSKLNNEGYLQLRKIYNQNKNPVDLMTLIAYCYNNQIRFNSKWGFNRAFGKNRSEFNETMKINLIQMIDKIHITNVQFTNYNFNEFDFNVLSPNDFVYCDPPYLITNADYSIQASWNEDKEKELLTILDNLHNKNIKFALSNVIEHDNKRNDILFEWSKKYNIHNLNSTYANANADKKLKINKTREVLISNY